MSPLGGMIGDALRPGGRSRGGGVGTGLGRGRSADGSGGPTISRTMERSGLRQLNLATV